MSSPAAGREIDRGVSDAAGVGYSVGQYLRHVWRQLKRDQVLWILTTVLAAVVVVTVFPILNETQAQAWGDTFANLILYGVATVAVMAGASAIPSKRERVFWRLVCLPMATLFFVYCIWGAMWLWVPDDLWSPALELITQGVYLAFYVGFSLAIDSIVIVGEELRSGMLRWMRSIGLGVLLGGTLMYVAVVPTVQYSERFDAWPPILVTYAALDLLLCLRFLKTRATLADARWRGILGWMAAAFAAWAVVDAGEAAIYLGLFGEFEAVPVWELQWYIPIVLFVVGARIHVAHPRAAPEPPETKRSLLVGAGPLVGYTMAIPLVHLVLYNTDIPAPELRPAREIVAILALVVIGAIAVAYQIVIERENRSAHRKLKASRERYQSFVTTSVEGVWLVEFRPPIDIELPEDEQVARIYLQAYVAEANDAMARMHDHSEAKQILGKPLREITGLAPNNRANVSATRGFVRSGYQTLNKQTEYRDREGHTRYYEGSVSGIVEDGFLKRAWGTQVDVTQRELARAEKDKLQNQLLQSQKMETIGTLAGGIAHDFNNLLAPILGFSELAAVTVAPDDRQTRDYLEKISKSATRAKGLVDQILTVSRHREGVREAVNLAAVVEDAVGLLRQSVPASISITVDSDPACPPVLADPGQMHQVVMNLCTNASHAIGRDGGHVVLQLGDDEVSDARHRGQSPPRERRVVLTVTDDGAGMPPETVERAFEPFFTTRELGHGTGLGLSVVHGIVKGHGGSLSLESQEGKGTCVTVYLPATSANSEELGGGESNASPERSSSGKILLVDDEPDVLEVGAAMLDNAGYLVIPVADPLEALDTLKRDPVAYDLLLTDHTMPGMTGLELAQQALALNHSLPVIIASGYRHGQMPNGAGDFPLLGKPFTRRELLDTVAAALKSARGDDRPVV